MCRAENLYRRRKYLLLGVKKAKIGPQIRKTEFEVQNRVIHPTGILDGARKNVILGLKKAQKRNFTWTTKKQNYRGQKGENKASEAKNGI
jgi:hypothetical protein